jgi:hypothetical protein
MKTRAAMKTCAAVLAALLLFSPPALAQEGVSPAAGQSAVPAVQGGAAGGHPDDAAPHPALADGSDRWPGAVVIVILSMFLAAAVVGPIVRANMPEEVPPAHSHDEPPGASHHHGKSGTLNPEPYHGHADHRHADHGHASHGATGPSATDHGATDHRTADHGAADHGAKDHGATDHGATDHGTTDHGAAGGHH